MKDLYFVNLVLILLVNICTWIHKKCMIFFIFLHLYAYHILTYFIDENVILHGYYLILSMRMIISQETTKINTINGGLLL